MMSKKYFRMAIGFYSLLVMASGAHASRPLEADESGPAKSSVQAGREDAASMFKEHHAKQEKNTMPKVNSTFDLTDSFRLGYLDKKGAHGPEYKLTQKVTYKQAFLDAAKRILNADEYQKLEGAVQILEKVNSARLYDLNDADAEELTKLASEVVKYQARYLDQKLASDREQYKHALDQSARYFIKQVDISHGNYLLGIAK
jgi:hypothetical protein